MANFENIIVASVMLPLSLGVFLLPTYFARKKDHPAKTSIMITNIIGGVFYGIGWIIALIWVFNGADKKENNQKISTADELEKLFSLKEKGIITEKEFENKKRELI